MTSVERRFRTATKLLCSQYPEFSPSYILDVASSVDTFKMLRAFFPSTQITVNCFSGDYPDVDLIQKISGGGG